MAGNPVLLGLVTILTGGYYAVGLLSPSARRRRAARALRSFVLRDIRNGRRSFDDTVATDVLTWCDEVAETGRDVPLTLG
jgi:hypothetical protein